MSIHRRSYLALSLILGIVGCTAVAAADASFIREHYTKYEYQIPMRDGIKLFTIAYVPKDKTENYPIVLTRTPYRIAPYGLDKYIQDPGKQRGRYFQEGYIVVYQDVRGRYMSEGEFVQVRPYIKDKKNSSEIDETTDTFDTVDWLIKNIPGNNGRVGISGISYPGFYTSMGTIDAHPAVKATSPQAPVSKWMARDDWYHNGAFLLAHAFHWMVKHGRVHDEPTQKTANTFSYGTPDGYQFFLELTTLLAVTERYVPENVPFWHELMKHGTWDDFWKQRDILPHLRNIKPAVMVVGGWFDAENLYGALKTYASIEENNPDTTNMLVMGPWYHGQWNRDDGQHLGPIDFQSRTSDFYTEHVELPFFNYHLKDEGELDLPEALIFDTGSNEWHYLDSWPPQTREKVKLYLRRGGELTFERPQQEDGNFSEYISDPAKPVPYTAKMRQWYDKDYMLEDQRFASRRPDVLVFQTDRLSEAVTFAGPIDVSLVVSTSGTDSDWVVKVIDVFPDTTPDPISNPTQASLGGYQMLVRGDVLRGKFRNSLAIPEPVRPNQATQVDFTLDDILHTFKEGHRVMVQIQSSWFPLIDLNPQTFQDIYSAEPEDFEKATQRVYHSSYLEVGVIGKRR
jgi:putative CocE/NonD family hydrolase